MAGPNAQPLVLSPMRAEQRLPWKKYRWLLFWKQQRTDASWEPRLHEQGQGSPTPVNLLPRRPTFFIGVSKFSTYSARLLPSGMIFLYQPSFKPSSIVLRYPIRQTSVQETAQSRLWRKLFCFFDKIVFKYDCRSHMFLRHTEVIPKVIQ